MPVLKMILLITPGFGTVRVMLIVNVLVNETAFSSTITFASITSSIHASLALFSLSSLPLFRLTRQPNHLCPRPRQRCPSVYVLVNIVVVLHPRPRQRSPPRPLLRTLRHPRFDIHLHYPYVILPPRKHSHSSYSAHLNITHLAIARRPHGIIGCSRYTFTCDTSTVLSFPSKNFLILRVRLKLQ